jgi:hypothetical protein
MCLADDEQTLRELAQRQLCNIERIDAAEITKERFMADFEGKRPLILTNATNEWPSMRWDAESVTTNATLARVRLGTISNYLKGSEQNYLPASLLAKEEISLSDVFRIVFIPGQPLAERKLKMSVDQAGMVPDRACLLERVGRGSRHPYTHSMIPS